MVPFSHLARAAYCPRQLYYARREDDWTLPERVRERRGLAFRYGELRTAADATLAALPIDRPPATYRAALDGLAARDDWAGLVDPAATDRYLEGRDCHGRLDKLVDDDPPVPSVVSPGEPPERGVWAPQSVRAVAVAKALAWEAERPVERALVEYPAAGVVREVRLTTRRKAAYRRVLRTVRDLDAPPPRLRDRSKCGPCEYGETCGVRTRTLRSLLGL